MTTKGKAIDLVHKLDLVLAIGFAITGVALFLFGYKQWAVICEISAMISGLMAWLKPANRLMNFAQRKMIRTKSYG